MDHKTISSMFSVRAAGTVSSSLLVGYLFGTFLFAPEKDQGGRRKLFLLSICHTIIALSLLTIPFVVTFPQLLLGILQMIPYVKELLILYYCSIV